jgi:hypothetical protein
VQAFVYLRAEPSRIDDVVIELAGKHGVRHAVPVTGEWDVLIAVEGADFVSPPGAAWSERPSSAPAWLFTIESSATAY